MKTEDYLKTDPFKEILKEYNLKIEDFTCFNCIHKEVCNYSFGKDNINGSCIFLRANGIDSNESNKTFL